MPGKSSWFWSETTVWQPTVRLGRSRARSPVRVSMRRGQEPLAPRMWSWRSGTLWSKERLTTSWVSGLPVQIFSTPARIRLVNQPLVGMLTMAGWQWWMADRMMSGRSPRRNGSPPLKVIHVGAVPMEANTRPHSSAVSSLTIRS